MKQYTLSIRPEVFEKQMQAEHKKLGIDPVKWDKAMYAYCKLLLSKEKEQEDIMDIFKDYLGTLYSEIQSYHVKYPDNIDKFKEYMIRYDILQNVYNRYNDFACAYRNIKTECINRKAGELKLLTKIYEQEKEIEKLKSVIEGEI